MRRTVALALCLLLGACVPSDHAPRGEALAEPPALDTRDPSLKRRRLLETLWPRTTFFFAVGRSNTCAANDLSHFKPIRVTRRPGTTSDLLSLAMEVGVDRWSLPWRPPADPTPDWLRSVSIQDRTATIDFQPQMIRPAGDFCHGTTWMNEVVRTALQFHNVDRVRMEFGGNCHLAPFEGDPRSCRGFRRKSFEHPEVWGPIPRMTPPKSPPKNQIVFYNADCAMGSAFTNYSAHEVAVVQETQAVLTAAVQALLRYWFRHSPRLAEKSPRWIEIMVTDGVAILDWQSLRHLGWASTTCGGAGFASSLIRTASQFPTVDAVEFRFKGSCERFSAWQQGSGCRRATVDAHDQIAVVWSEA